MLKPHFACEKILIIWGIARSGIHAIAGWIYDSHPDQKLLLDDQDYGQEMTWGYKEEQYLSPHHYDGGKLMCGKNWIDDWGGAAKLAIIVLENHDLNCYQNDFWVKRNFTSENIQHVIVIRDIKNHYASFISITTDYKKAVGKIRCAVGPLNRVRDYSTDLWKMYAKEYLGLTSFLPENTIKINFNNWVKSIEYQHCIAYNLGFEGIPYQKVRSYGGGSSFDGFNFDGCATEMKVLDRWAMISEEERQSLMDIMAIDGELAELSSLI